MDAVAEFIGYFRIKSGIDHIEIELPDDSSVINLLRAVEDRLADREFRVLDGENLKHGVLLFRRTDSGGLERTDPSEVLSECGGRVLLANLMGGG